MSAIWYLNKSSWNGSNFKVRDLTTLLLLYRDFVSYILVWVFLFVSFQQTYLYFFSLSGSPLLADSPHPNVGFLPTPAPGNAAFPLLEK